MLRSTHFFGWDKHQLLGQMNQSHESKYGKVGQQAYTPDKFAEWASRHAESRQFSSHWSLSVPSPAAAKVEWICGVSYDTRSGWSDEDVRSVDFVMGSEIRDHWAGIQANAFYVEIWFGPGQVALVKLPNPNAIIVGGTFEQRDLGSLFAFRRTLEGSQVNLDNGRERRWAIRPDHAPVRREKIGDISQDDSW
jgi:hypothetical protein